MRPGGHFCERSGVVGIAERYCSATALEESALRYINSDINGEFKESSLYNLNKVTGKNVFEAVEGLNASIS